jgi:uncharacterized protein YjbI with pentapeptide repeats
MIAAVLTALAAWVATWWLLSVAGPSADLRVQAIKAGLTVAAGTGGAAALLLATRRQWLQERDQTHREETDQANQLYQERLATITELDATERRITDLYTKAVDQLGSEKAPVRLGGLYALERLAQDNLNQRQTIVNVICAYLRMPFTHSTAGTAPNLAPSGRDMQEQPEAVASRPALQATCADAREELQVRLTAQRILAAHLKANGDIPHQVESNHRPGKYSKFWEDIRIDLTGATLVNFNFHACNIFSFECSGANFVGGVDFAQATFVSDVNFSEAIFSPNDKGLGDPAADFSGATFRGSTDFVDARFTGRADFSDAIFEGQTNFCAHFSYATFAESTFKVNAWFAAAEFTDSVSFKGATFCGDANFTEATFTQVRLGKPAYFEKASFESAPILYGAIVVMDSAIQIPLKTSSSWPAGWKTVAAKNNTECLVRQPNSPEVAE